MYTMSAGISPLQAFQIDTKMDDGLPNLGIVQARGTAASATVDGIFPTVSLTDAAQWSTTTPASAAAGDCTTGGLSNAADTTNAYATVSAAANNQPACNLRIRASF
jgi:hypothetical protein